MDWAVWFSDLTARNVLTTKSIIMEQKTIDNLVKEILTLRDKVYSTLKEQWTNSYGKDQFEKPYNH